MRIEIAKNKLKPEPINTRTMKHTLKLLLVVTIILLGSCSPKVETNLIKNYNALDYNEEVLVIGLNEERPKKSEFLGLITIKDSGFTTKCSYKDVLNEAKLEARKIGGNAIKITTHRPPSVGSSCHRITADILRIDNIDNYSPKEEEEVLLDVDYAILNVYRYGGAGSLINYDLYLGDSIVCRVKSNFKTTIHVRKDGLNTLWAKTESKIEVPIDIKIGKEYYLRCGLSLGAFIGRPQMELVDNKIGKSEFESFNAKK